MARGDLKGLHLHLPLFLADHAFECKIEVALPSYTPLKGHADKKGEILSLRYRNLRESPKKDPVVGMRFSSSATTLTV